MSRYGRIQNSEGVNIKMKSYAQVVHNTESKVYGDANLKNERTSMHRKAK